MIKFELIRQLMHKLIYELIHTLREQRRHTWGHRCPTGARCQVPNWWPITIVPWGNRGLKSIAIFAYKQRLLSLEIKTKLVQHVESEWMRDWKSVRVRECVRVRVWEWLLSIEMKTEVVQHVKSDSMRDWKSVRVRKSERVREWESEREWEWEWE